MTFDPSLKVDLFTFQRICQDLAHLHEQGHEWLDVKKIQTTKGIAFVPATKAKANWFSRLIRWITQGHFFRKSNECEKVVSTALQFFKNHQDFCIGQFKTIQKLSYIKTDNSSLNQQLTDFLSDLVNQEIIQQATKEAKETQELAKKRLESAKAEAQTILEKANQEKELILIQAQLEKDQIKQQLEAAQGSAKKTLELAKTEAQTMLEKANQEKEQILTQAQLEKDQIKQQLDEEIKTKENHLAMLKEDQLTNVDTWIVCGGNRKVMTFFNFLNKVSYFRSCEDQHKNMRKTESLITEEEQVKYPNLKHVFDMQDHSEQTISTFVQYLENPETLNSIIDVWVLVDLYMLSDQINDVDLHQQCYEKLKQSLSPTQMLLFLSSYVMPEQDPLMMFVIDTIANSFESSAQMFEFNGIKHENLLKILNSKELRAYSEESVFTTIKHWCERQSTTIKKSIQLFHHSIDEKKLANYIRFSELPSEIYQQNLQQGWITTPQIYDALRSPLKALQKIKKLEVNSLTNGKYKIVWRPKNPFYFAHRQDFFNNRNLPEKIEVIPIFDEGHNQVNCNLQLANNSNRKAILFSCEYFGANPVFYDSFKDKLVAKINNLVIPLHWDQNVITDPNGVYEIKSFVQVFTGCNRVNQSIFISKNKLERFCPAHKKYLEIDISIKEDPS